MRQDGAIRRQLEHMRKVEGMIADVVKEVSPPVGDHCKVLLVFPSFNPNSFWALEDTVRLVGAHATAPPLGLLTVAAMLPQHWDMKLVNRNVETLTDEHLGWADVVFTGGMLPQSPDCFEVIKICKDKGIPVAVGGPDATSRPLVYEEADFMVLGEVEGIMDDFVAAWRHGDRSGRFEAVKFQADVTKTPIPRYDLIDFKDYLYVCLQFSRGCPFTCEFCDIIELYGRVPRTKTSAQVLAELDRLIELGYVGHVDFVDDNLIGNKKAIKKFLPDLIAWQKKNKYPFHFSTEASLNLADDDELLMMMEEANFFTVFMGIESGNTETLIAASKKQNTRRSIGDSVNKLYGAGMCAIAGFILGFDTEKEGVAEEMIDTINSTSIPICMIGLLTALPNTQLNRRLQKEGRMILDLAAGQSPEGSGDQCTAGLNFTTLRPRRDILLDYKIVLESIYSDAAFFERQTRVTKMLKRSAPRRKFNLKYEVRNLTIFGRLVREIYTKRPGMMRPFLRYLAYTITHNPRALEFAMTNVMMYMHVGRFMNFVVSDMDRRIAEIDAAEAALSVPPSPQPAASRESVAA